MDIAAVYPDESLTLPIRGGVLLDHADADPRYLIGEIKKLRAILAPQLDNPWVEGKRGDVFCLWCDREEDDVRVHGHNPVCPVLRKDELLGRA